MNLDTSNSLAIELNDECARHSADLQLEKTNEMNTANELNGESNQNLSMLNDSIFNRLVNDINSTHLSIQTNGNTSSHTEIKQNGYTNQMNESNKLINNDCEVHRIDNSSLNSDQTKKVPLQTNSSVNVNEIESTHTVSCGDNGLNELSDNVDGDVSSELRRNHIETRFSKKIDSNKNCDNNIIPTTSSTLKYHDETLKNIDEIVSDDLRRSKLDASSSNANLQHKPGTSSKQVLSRASCSSQTSSAAANDSQISDDNSQDFLPAAESTVSAITETSLLSKSEQDVLFKDRASSELFSDLWNNAPIQGESKADEVKSPRLSIESPLTFFRNGIDPNIELKTYSRNRKRFVETKTISTQTSSPCTSICSSPVMALDREITAKITLPRNEAIYSKKHLLTDKDEDDESFLRDIFNTPESRVQRSSGNTSRIQSPKTYLSSTPIQSTSHSINKITETTNENTANVQDEANSTNASNSEPVKRKRGRPRKYPLPLDSDGNAILPTPKSQKEKKPKIQNTELQDQSMLSERMCLRPRRPRIVHRKSIFIEKPKLVHRKSIYIERPKRVDILKRRRTRLMSIRLIKSFNMPSTPQQATILQRKNYNKTFNVNRSQVYDNTFDNSKNNSSIYSYKYRTNGQMNNSETLNNTADTSRSTILQRRSYLKPNLTQSSMSSFSSSMYNASPINNRSFIIQRIQRYSRMVVNTTVTNQPTGKRRGRKKGSKNKVRKSYLDSADEQKDKSNDIQIESNTKLESNNTTEKVQKPPADNELKQQIESIEAVNNERKPIQSHELNSSMEIRIHLTDIQSTLSATQNLVNESDIFANKHRNFSSEDTETDMTNELTTDPESAVEDTDDSTRKSKRCRKRPKILDL